MVNIPKRLHESGILYQVRKPIRYLGGEYLSAVPPRKQDSLSFLLAFPDIYDIGMSHLGLKILYALLNAVEGVHAERSFLPWSDMRDWMVEQSIPLWGLESYRPAATFDVIGITLQYELSFPGALDIIHLAGLELHAKDRSPSDPLILGGGPCAFNPEPLVPFFDGFLIGEAEEAIVEIAQALKTHRHAPRQKRLEALSTVQGMYLPNLETAKSRKIFKRRADFSSTASPLQPVVPFLEVVHDRAQFEVLRGCERACRFCHAFVAYRPYRERKGTDIVCQAKTLLKQTGYDEISLLSLSTLDHSEIQKVITDLVPFLHEQGIALSIPSTRADRFGLELAEEISTLKKSGLTFAPEAGSQRLRELIHKDLSEEEILSTLSLAKKKGWRRVKLYFMVGLPTETSEDIDAIIELVKKIRRIGLKEINISVAGFVPKPHTPLQYERQASVQELQDKFRQLLPLKQMAKVEFHDPYHTFLEGIIARGDRQLAPLIEWVHSNGGHLEAWKDLFDRSRWHQGLQALNMETDQYTAERPRHTTLPWSHLG